MICKTLKFKDIEGKEHEIKAFFHLNDADLGELSVYKKGGLKAYMEQCMDTEDGYGAVKFLKTMVEKAYGKKVRDPELGTIFMKDPAETAKFINSEAYAVLFNELMSNADVASEFINGLVATAAPSEENA